jgi:pimeloyl-ACP methyl ester carboxylesterase
VEKVILMGHSMGAGVASWYAATFPERVERLIMLDLISFGPFPLKKQSRATRKSVQMAIQIHDTLQETTKVPK